MLTARRVAVGSARVKAVTASAAAAAKAAWSKPCSTLWNEVRLSAKPGRGVVNPCHTVSPAVARRLARRACNASPSVSWLRFSWRPARRARSATGRIQVSAAVETLTEPSPVASPASASAARCSHAAGKATWRGALSGSAAARVRRMRTPRQAAMPRVVIGGLRGVGSFSMGRMLIRALRLGKPHIVVRRGVNHKILWISRFWSQLPRSHQVNKHASGGVVRSTLSRDGPGPL